MWGATYVQRDVSSSAVGISMNHHDPRRIHTMHARLISLAVLGIALSTVTLAAAKDTNKNQGNFIVSDTVRIGSTDLHPGRYKAQWKDDGSGTVKIDIIQDGKTVAMTEGKLKSLQGSSYDAVIVESQGGTNAKAINEIDFGKRKEALVLGGE
jgi:hypothetical protein